MFQNCSGQKNGESILASLDSASQIDQIHEITSVDLSETNNSLLMNRKMLYSLFIDILGPSSIQIAPLARLKVDKAVFGSPCSIYDYFKSSRAAFGLDAESDACVNSADSNQLGAVTEPSGNALQESTINDICVRATESSAVYEYIMTQVRDVPTVVIPANNDGNVLKLIALFYRGKPIPQAGLIQAMKAVVGNPATTDGWKKAFLTTCTSVHWQAL